MTLIVRVPLNALYEPTTIVQLHLGVVVTRLVVIIIVMPRIAQSNWPIGNNKEMILAPIRNQ